MRNVELVGHVVGVFVGSRQYTCYTSSLLSTIADLVLIPFRRHVEVLASENTENGLGGNNVQRGKGNSAVKLLYQAPHPKTMENRSLMV
jgi:hypothetical protein